MEKKEVIKKLSDFIKIKSISTDKSYFPEIKKAVEFLSSWLKSLGFKVVLIEKTKPRL